MNLALAVAALVLVAVCGAHSWLGERALLVRLLRREGLPKVMGSVDFTKRLLRFAWHVTSIAWLGLAAVLALLALPGAATAPRIGLAIGICFLVQGAVALVASRGRHLSWVAFLVIGVLAIAATRG